MSRLTRALVVAGGVLAADALARRHEGGLVEVVPLGGPARPRGPEVAAIVPARDEAELIAGCIAGLREQAGAGVTVVDDASTDATGRRAAAAGARVRRLDGDPPPGWTGKTRALAAGAASATAPWLAFVDADVALAPGAIPALVAHAEHAGLDAVSPLLAQRCAGAADSLVVPLAYWQFAVGMPGRGAAGLPGDGHAILNGQCLVVRRAAYEACGGHAHPAVRATPVEDAALARRLVAAGHRVALVRGPSLGTVRMYSGAAAVRRGFVKNAAELLAADWRRGLAVAATGALLAQPPAIIAGALRDRRAGDAAALAAAWLLPAAVLAPRYRGAGVPGAVALAHPVAALALQAIAVESLARHAARRPALWKGRVPPAARPAAG